MAAVTDMTNEQSPRKCGNNKAASARLGFRCSEEFVAKLWTVAEAEKMTITDLFKTALEEYYTNHNF